MKPELRLRHAEDFRRLRRIGRVYRHPLVMLSLCENHHETNRYGFITGKRLGSAVKRNRVRRILREIMRNLHPQLDWGYDILLIAHPSIVGQPFTQIRRTVVELCVRSGILKGREVA